MEFVERLKSSIDIVKVIGDYVRLRRVGSTGRYIGLCPFHTEKTPSFSVNQARQFYKCFGCGAGGDALNFVMTIDGLTFREALELLAERNGVPLPQRRDYSDPESRLRGTLLEMHSLAAGFFQATLRGPAGAEARGYLARRGVSPENAEAFELGYAEPGGQALTRRLTQAGFPAEQLESSGLVRKRPEGGFYDYFRGRLIFPIHSESGKVIGFGGRALREEDQPKYLNSPETPIYRKTSVLYHLHRARDAMRRSGRVVLVEGYMDVIGVVSAGVREVVATCGVALTSPQARAIRRHADTVVLNFDPDSAGAGAAERAIQLLLDEGLRSRVLALQGGAADVKLDPDEYVKRFGADAYRAQVEAAPGYFHWLAERARARFDVRTAEGRTDAFKFLLPVVQRLHDPLERAAVANELAERLGVEAGLVLDQFRRSATGRRPAPQAAAPCTIPAAERMLLAALVGSARVRQEMLPELSPSLTQGFLTRDIFETLRSMTEAGAPFTFPALEDRLEEPARVLLHQALAADDTQEEEILRNQAQACLRRLRSDLRKRNLDELRAKIKAAEREGRLDEALGLAAELSQLDRQGRGAAQ
jgi:DNA primase